MSDDQKDETTTEDSAPKAPKEPKKPKSNPFLKSLRDNQVAQAKEALIQTICDRAENTIGSVLDALESDEGGDFIMLEIFRGMTIEELVKAVSPAVIGEPSVPPASASEEDAEDDEEDDGDLDDDDEFDDDGSLEDEEPAPKPKKRSTSKKRASSKKKTTKKKAPPKSKGSSGDSGKGANEYQKEILSCLRTNKARNGDSAMSGPDIRNLIGGSDVEFRTAMGVLREKGRVLTVGKARGTKYFRARKTSE